MLKLEPIQVIVWTMPDVELIEHLVRTTGLEPSRAARILAEVLALQDETVGQFVRRRHRELQREGFANAEIYGRLADELLGRRFAASDLSERQLRRLVYG